MSDPNQPEAVLQQLAHTIQHAGLETPITITLDVLHPIAMITSQMARFAHPFVRSFGWDSYALALADEKNWQRLRQLLAETGD